MRNSTAELYLPVRPSVVTNFKLVVPFVTNLARSAKVAERAICFTDRNFLLFFYSFF